ncbi:hypothetical protein GCM10010435_15580 [Winogradskya consettensis]|uniref:Glycosyltransferase RgtA/B/C/D-like domain-containing protein n=1 Tax=Winogradskya consettensis TaxID=113560 RepID=A0A919SCK1_9ACTN|nr:glycosyltransferase family 39 protein [Actinoplanes consettensis]GIM69356.1 hypothetical protein Aco04nite_14860 [Actinoplanes consettensis]
MIAPIEPKIGSSSRFAWWSRVVPWLIPALAMLIIGRIGWVEPALGWDEHATWSAAMRTPGQLMDFAGHMDGVISPYYLFMHYWTSVFGDSLGWFRLPSLLAVAIGVGLVGELGRRLFTPGVGLVGGLIVALVPQMSRYAQDARAYGFSFLFAILSTLLLYVALSRPNWWRWIAYGAALTLLGYTHMLGLLVLSGHVVAVAVRWSADHDRRLLIRWPIVVAAAIALVSPLIRLGLTQRGTQLEWVPEMDLHQVLIAPGVIFGERVVGLLVIGLALAARWERPKLLGELTALAVLPPVVLITVSFFTSSLWVPRYVLYVIAPLALLAAVALRGLPWRSLTAVLLIAAVGFEFQQSVRDDRSHGGMDFRVAAGIVEKHQQPGDAIVYGRISTWSVRSGFDYEMRDEKIKPKDVMLRRTAAEVGQLDAVECPDVTCFDNQRVWYVGARQGGDALSNLGPQLKAKFTTEYERTGYWVIPLGTIALFERRTD